MSWQVFFHAGFEEGAIAFMHTLRGNYRPRTDSGGLGCPFPLPCCQSVPQGNGAYLRGAFTPCQSRDCSDMFVSEVILENVKDRAVPIFGIYLRLGYSYYLEVEDFEDGPLLLRPYETYRKGFGPIEFYGINDNKIDLNDLLSNQRIKKSLFLSISDGK